MKLFLKISALVLVAVMALTVLASCGAKRDGKEKEKVTLSDDFEFYIEWGFGGSYDSETGRLVSIRDIEAEDRYSTEMILSAEMREEIKKIIENSGFFDLPDEIENDPHVMATPASTYVLTVKSGGKEKTVTWKEVSLAKVAEEGRIMQGLMNAIVGLIKSTEEYKSIPEPDFGYI